MKSINKHKIESFLVLAILALGGFSLWLYSNETKKLPPKEEVLAEDVNVSASVPLNPTIAIKPENRIPPLGNDSLEIEVRIDGTTSTLSTESVTVNNLGLGRMQSKTVDQVSVGNHDVSIKGLSHLRKTFANKSFGPANEFVLDLTDETLKAGDTHPTEDNYVNSMDISFSIINVYSDNIRADLNRDGVVNSLDFPTMISHLYESGDN